MQITMSADYALRAVIDLADNSDGRLVAAGEIASRQDIPLSYAVKVLQALARAGIVVCQAGRKGGVRLLRNADELSVLDVVEAVDGPLALNRCLLRPRTCPRDRDCPVHLFWADVQDSVKSQMGKMKVAQFVRKLRAKRELRRAKP
jgi:Rrf2 family protein